MLQALQVLCHAQHFLGLTILSFFHYIILPTQTPAKKKLFEIEIETN